MGYGHMGQCTPSFAISLTPKRATYLRLHVTVSLRCRYDNFTAHIDNQDMLMEPDAFQNDGAYHLSVTCDRCKPLWTADLNPATRKGTRERGQMEPCSRVEGLPTPFYERPSAWRA